MSEAPGASGTSGTTRTADLAATFCHELATASGLRWKMQGLGGGSLPYVLASLLSGLERPALLMTATPARAEELAAELRTLFGETTDRHFLDRRVHTFAARDVPPLEMVSPPVELEASRLSALYQLSKMEAPVVVCSPEALLVRTMPPERLHEAALHLGVGDGVDLEAVCRQLDGLGYRRTGLVEEAGEVAVRGGIVDVWPAGSEYPCRCELFGDEIESIRYFHPADQRSFAGADTLVVLPVGAFEAARLTETGVRNAVHARCNELMLAATERRQLDASLAEGVRFPGVELLLPYVHDHCAWLGDYLREDTLVAQIDVPAIDAGIDDATRALADASEAAHEAGTFFPDVAAAYVDAAELRALLERRPRLELDPTGDVDVGGGTTGGASGTAGNRIWHVEARGNAAITAARARVKSRRGDQRFGPMVEELESSRADGARVVVLASDPTQLERLAHLLELSEVRKVRRADDFGAALTGDPAVLWLVQGHLEHGFRMAADNLVVVTDEEIFGQRRRAARRRKVSRAHVLSALSAIKPGDFMVHADHGVGLYHGLKHIVAGGTEGDFIHLEYAGGDRYYLPVDRINLVEKYTGAGTTAPALSRLGSPAWTRTKKRAKESILKLAHELLEIEAFRSVHTRRVFAERSADFEEFEARFPFEETDGQKAAVADITGDLLGEKPMDRVVCGDVGYGKTEVALRAAYLTAMAGRQVALLVPTTVLARQHYDTIVKRFEGYPVEIGMLSRFHSRAENTEIVDRLKAGTVDIVVGTHRMVQHDVSFARLGLLVIDEEHRFGVKAKERIKRLRREVDVLTMTATPIPRTLQLSLTGVRDLSLIETPPVDRLSIRTYVARYDDGLVKQAIDRELARGGQVFFVHNRVMSIGHIASEVGRLAPKARIGVAHGQMRETELEQIMLTFLAGKIDVLVCTSIIESGLDIPNANTILVNRADTFGLAQLYQIRGRVGRSHRRAYAYLLVPSDRVITDEARQRLSVLQELDDLGSGFRIAAHDMEIRGAGNLLGKEQSGHVLAVGFELFMQMMDEASKELRGQPAGPRIEPEIDLGAEAYIPDGYIDDVSERLLVYKRMANAQTPAEFADLADELADRFGPLPHQVQDFTRVMGLRPALKRLAVESLKVGGSSVALRFHVDSSLDPAELVRFATEDADRFRVRPGGVLTMKLQAASAPAATHPSWDAMVDEIESFLVELTSKLGSGPAAEQPTSDASAPS